MAGGPARKIQHRGDLPRTGDIPMACKTSFTLIPVAALLLGGLLSSQAAAFGVPGSFPPDALSSLMEEGRQVVVPDVASPGATTPVRQ